MRLSHPSFPRRLESQSDSLVPTHNIPWRDLDCDAVTTPFNDTIQYSSTPLKVCVFSYHVVIDLLFLKTF